MILKASQRGNGADLAAHLMRLDDNEHVHLHELRGFACDDLAGAFQEADAISRATKCKQYLFSLSLSPPEQERVPVHVFESAIDRIEQRLGLIDHPRAIVFHEKQGRRHAHCVWSRIDDQTMTAKPLPFFKNRLMEVSRDLYLEHGWSLPRGMIDRCARDPTNFTLAEWQQAKRQGVDPRWTKAVIQDCWNGADGRKAFEAALQSRGFWLAKGDRRGHLVLDHTGEVYALARQLNLKTKELRARIGDGDDLNSVDDTKALIARRMTPAIGRHIKESRARFQQNSATLGHAKMRMTQEHRAARTELDHTLDAEWQAETRERAGRLPKGMRGLWHRITGQYQLMRAANERAANLTRDRHAIQRQSLIDTQRGERAGLQSQFKELRARQAAQLLELRADIGRYLAFSRSHEAGRERDLGRESGRDVRRDREASSSRTHAIDRSHSLDGGAGPGCSSGRSLGLKLER